MKLEKIRNKPNLYRHPKSGIIYFRMYRDGLGRCERSTGETVLARAETEAEKIRTAFLGETLITKKNERRLVEVEWADFLSTKKSKAPTTYQSIETHGRLHLLPFFGEKFPHEITEALWAEYVAQSREKSPARKLFNDRKYLSMFLGYLYRNDRIKKVPKLIDPDPPRAKGKVYSDQEIRRLLDEASADLSLQIKMAVTMGMRKSEILKLSWDRVDLDKRVIHLRAQDTKIRKARSFGISDVVFKELYARFNSGAEIPPFVFPSPTNPAQSVGRGGNKKAWAACKRRARVKGRFHDLRHTFLTKAFKNSVNPALICEYAGLSLDEAQRTYLHFTVEDTRPVSNLVRFE